MNKIPTHKLSEIAFMRYVSEREDIPPIGYAHRDEYYIFLYVEKGYGKILVDFKEYEFSEGMVYCMLPGQVHFPMGNVKVSGWILAIDSLLVKDDYKEIFESISMYKPCNNLNEYTVTEIKQCAINIQRRLNSERQVIEETILHSLLSYYVGLFAEIYQKGYPLIAHNRFSSIAFQFKSLLSANYKTLKRPSQYASLLNLSSVYLNEAVKKTIGFSVSDCIQNEIILQAKRLLYYTNLSVKEIALELGYEDWAYFTRLFTKATNLSPTQFKKKYLK